MEADFAWLKTQLRELCNRGDDSERLAILRTIVDLKKRRVDAAPMLLSIPACVRTAAVMRPFLVLPDFQNLMFTCKQLRAEATEERVRRLVPSWNVGEDPDEALRQTPMWFDRWRAEAQLNISSHRRYRLPGDSGDRIKVCFPGTTNDFWFVTPAHVHRDPQAQPFGDRETYRRQYRLRNSHRVRDLGVDINVLQDTAAESFHRLDVSVATPECVKFADKFLLDMANSIGDFVMDAKSWQLNCFDKIKQEESERWQYREGGSPLDEAVRNECRRVMRQGRPLRVPIDQETKNRFPDRRRVMLVASVTRRNREARIPDHLQDDPIAVATYKAGMEIVDFPVFCAATRQLLPRDQRFIRPGDVTADLFSIVVRTNKKVCGLGDFHLSWRGSILFNRAVVLVAVPRPICDHGNYHCLQDSDCESECTYYEDL